MGARSSAVKRDKFSHHIQPLRNHHLRRIQAQYLVSELSTRERRLLPAPLVNQFTDITHPYYGAYEIAFMFKLYAADQLEIASKVISNNDALYRFKCLVKEMIATKGSSGGTLAHIDEEWICATWIYRDVYAAICQTYEAREAANSAEAAVSRSSSSVLQHSSSGLIEPDGVSSEQSEYSEYTSTEVTTSTE